MRTALMVIQAIACIILITTILLQEGKGDGMSSSIMGGTAQLSGSKERGFDGLLSKLTKIAAFLFIIVAIALVAIQ